jgi:inorganic pyrophosphatase
VNLDLVPAGANPPESINVVIEVPIGGEPVKYELDKKSGAIFVDRILHTAMRYPANYGFVRLRGPGAAGGGSVPGG